MSKIVVNGITYDYQMSKNANEIPFVFLHGFLGSKSDFTKVYSQLDHSFLALDLLGFADNRTQTIASHRFSQNDQIDDLENIFDRLGLTQINLVGYSMGGRLAIAYALKYSKRVSSLFLESTTAGIQTESLRASRMEHDKKLANKVIQLGMNSFVQDWEKLPLFKSQQNVSSTDFTFMHRQRINQSPINVAKSLLEMGTGKQPNLWPRLSELSDIPTTIIVGCRDKKFIEIGKQLHSAISKSTIYQVQDAGHNVHFEAPVDYRKILLKNLYNEKFNFE